MDNSDKRLSAQPRSQGLSSLPPLSLRTMEAEKRDPGNEVAMLLIERIDNSKEGFLAYNVLEMF